METSIILPVRDEPALDSFLSELRFVLQNFDYEIIVVMGDKEQLNLSLTPSATHKVFKSYADSLERAILLGFSVAQGNKIIVMDADSSHPIDTLPTVIKKLNEYEMVAASRFSAKQSVNTDLYRQFVSYCFMFAAKIMGSTLEDPMTGYFGIRKDVLKNIQFKPYTWKTALEINIKAKPKTYTLPIVFGERNAGKSKTSTKIGLKLIKDMIEEMIKC